MTDRICNSGHVIDDGKELCQRCNSPEKQNDQSSATVTNPVLQPEESTTNIIPIEEPKKVKKLTSKKKK